MRQILATHEWTEQLEDGSFLYGLSRAVCHELGTVSHLLFPAVGSLWPEGSVWLVLESLKAATDLCAPVDAEVVEVNLLLLEDIAHLNEDPEGRGWLLRYRPATQSLAPRETSC